MATTAIEAAVNWWADKLTACKQSGLSAEERRDPANQSYQLAEMLMLMNKPAVTEEQLEKFKMALTATLNCGIPYCISVDYQPDCTLYEALQFAGISADMGTLPIKTNMWIRDGQVEVSYGYGAPIERIYPV